MSGPIPAYNNPPIQPQFYEPSRFVIEDISFGTKTTTVTTTEDLNYQIGQYVRLLIPDLYGAQQLNNAAGYVIDIPADDQAVLDIPSAGTNTFITNPITASITGATQANPCVLTCSSPFTVGQYIQITGVSGMTQLNGLTFEVIASNATTVTINTNSGLFSPYTSGGTATLVNYDTTKPQIIALGDISSGILSTTGRNIPSTNVPGAFINVS